MCPVLQARQIGSGPRLLLVHGGVGPEVGWEKQKELSERFSLIVPWRRGYGESPPTEQQDFETDAEDLLELLGTHAAHAAAFSYGALGLLVAASRQPKMFLSLTLIEPPLFMLAGENPAVQELLGQLGQFAQSGPQGAPAELEGFLSLQRLSAERGHPPPPAMRPPFDAQIDLEAIRSEGVPALVVSGDHHPGFERTCDALAEKLDAERAVLPGEGHAPQRTDAFNGRLEEFLAGQDITTEGPG
jgi:pimeloyl-ACP methyl ester carboxylesterase